MKVGVDDQRCRGQSATLCPEVFGITDDGYAVAEPSEVPAGIKGSAYESIENCPERAISEIDD